MVHHENDSVSNHHHTFTFQTLMAKRGLRIKYVNNFSSFWGKITFWVFAIPRNLGGFDKRVMMMLMVVLVVM